MPLDPAYWSNFRAAKTWRGVRDDAWRHFSVWRGVRGTVCRLRFGEGLRFEEDELDGEGEVTGDPLGQLRVPLHQPDHGGVESGLRRGGGLPSCG